MKKNPLLSVVMVMSIALMLSACSSGGTETTAAETAVESVVEETSATETATVEETMEAETSTEATAEVEETTATETTADEISAEEVTETEAGTDDGNEAEVSVSYIDFDDMSFYVNGVKYTLGVSTLQDMIDDGVPFDESDLENAGNNLSSNYQSSGFRINLGDYWTAQVYVLNDTDSGKPINECYLNEVYLPVHTDETQDILSFAFPTNLTMEELVANAGEPDDTYHYDGDDGYYADTYTYQKASTQYFSNSEYEFEFTNGELRYITITYMP